MKTIFTLRNKIVVLFLVLVLVPLAVIGVFSVSTIETLIENLVLRQLENVAADKAAILERWLDERKQDLQVIAGTSLVKSMDPKTIAPYLDLIQTHYGVYNDITVVSAQNEVVLSTKVRDSDAADGHTSPGKAESLVLSPITYLPEERESTFQISAPVFDNGNRIGTVNGTVGTNKIITIILQVALGKTGECYLVDKNGTFLAHKEPRRILAENISQSESFKNIFGNRDRRKTYLDYRDIEVLGTSRKVGETDWYLVVEQDRDEAFQSVVTLKRHILITMFLAIGSAFILTWVISYHIVRPVRNLSRSANTLAMADFSAEIVRTERSDEIGVLCRAFADMAQKIRHRQDLLEKQFDLKAAELHETDQTLKQFKLIAERSEKFAALGRLGAAVAHEIRTPLTSLKLFLESVQSEIEISQEYAEDFTVAMGQIVRIEAAINRLLDFTKPKKPVFSTIQIAPLVNEAVSMIRPLANKRECVVNTQFLPNLPGIKADYEMLEEALINLLINSLEAMPVKGRITVTVKTDAFEADQNPKPGIRIDISDTGPGIAAENMNFVFDPFFTTKPSGTGLGLPMVLNTVKRHDGEILVRNTENGGAVFSILLPAQIDEHDAH